MRKFLSHKVVKAAKILEFDLADFGAQGEGLNLLLEGHQHYVIAPKEMVPFQRLIERHADDGDVGYIVVYEDGYKSWSPTDIFEAGYSPIEGEPTEDLQQADRMDRAMSFGQALIALKAGKRVAREGWNGKGMWLVLVGGTPLMPVKHGTIYHRAGLDEVQINAHIDMMTATGDMQPGWLASQTDMLANDWNILE